MSEDLKIPPMPEPPFGLTGYVGRDGNEIITINRAGFDDVARWGEQGWSEAQTQARRADEAETLNATLRQEAQIHAMESRTYRTIVEECYQIATGATGEPGTWNGAAPIRALAAERDALKARVAERGDSIYITDGHGTLYGTPEVIGWITDELDRLESTLAQRDREVLALRAQLTRVIGGHNAPDDCYSTGPMTGDHITDLVSCPSCEGIALLASTAQAGAEAERRLLEAAWGRVYSATPLLNMDGMCPGEPAMVAIKAAILGTESGEGRP